MDINLSFLNGGNLMIKHRILHAFLALSATIVGDQVVKQLSIFFMTGMHFILRQYPDQYQWFIAGINNFYYGKILMILLLGFVWGICFKFINTR